MRSARQGGREAWREKHASTDRGARRGGHRVARGSRPQLPQWAEREDEDGTQRAPPQRGVPHTPSLAPSQDRGSKPKDPGLREQSHLHGPPSSAGSPTSPAITVTSPQPPGPRRLEKGGNALRDGNCPTCVTQPASGSPEIPNPKSEGGARRGERGTSSKGNKTRALPQGPHQSLRSAPGGVSSPDPLPPPIPSLVQPQLLQGALPASSQPQDRGPQGPEYILPSPRPRVGSESVGNEGGTNSEAGQAKAIATLRRNRLRGF